MTHATLTSMEEEINGIWGEACDDLIDYDEAKAKTEPLEKAFLQACREEDEAKKIYLALIEELEALEESTGLYLVDVCVAGEDVLPLREGHVGYWSAMLSTTKMSAGIRASEAGTNINALIGRVIY